MDETRPGFQPEPDNPLPEKNQDQITAEFPEEPLDLDRHLDESPRGYEDLPYATRLLEYSRNRLVQMCIWAELEASRISKKMHALELPGDEQKRYLEAMDDPESLESRYRRYYKQMVSGVSPEDVIADENREFFRFLQHHIRYVDSELFERENHESPYVPNQEIQEIIIADDPRQTFCNLFNQQWDVGQRDVRRGGADPIEQPELPSWLLEKPEPEL